MSTAVFNNNTNGVYEDSLGLDDFIYNWDSSSKIDGKYTLIARTTDIRDGSANISMDILIDNDTSPTVIDVNPDNASTPTKSEFASIWAQFGESIDSFIRCQIPATRCRIRKVA